MSLYEDWRARAEEANDPKGNKAFWDEYFAKETEAYKKILGNHETRYAGTLAELSETFGMDETTFVGFLDGINTSLGKEIKLETLKSASKVALDVNFEKLYFNMMDCKADWLYTLPEWDAILSEEDKKRITKEFRASKMYVNAQSVLPNDPCPCGSGKKYKKCCARLAQ